MTFSLTDWLSCSTHKVWTFSSRLPSPHGLNLPVVVSVEFWPIFEQYFWPVIDWPLWSVLRLHGHLNEIDGGVFPLIIPADWLVFVWERGERGKKSHFSSSVSMGFLPFLACFSGWISAIPMSPNANSMIQKDFKGIVEAITKFLKSNRLVYTFQGKFWSKFSGPDWWPKPANSPPPPFVFLCPIWWPNFMFFVFSGVAFQD